ncbi:MAG: class I SAM-dependent methyltransferase [Gammaproteobacteria bacterium]
MTTIAKLYNCMTPDWERYRPVLLSDFTARPFVLGLCEPIDGTVVLDAGCGEGYMARQLRQRGAAKVEGIDISSGMIEAAHAAEQANPLGISFSLGNVVDLSRFPDSSFDLVLAVFVFNYLTLNATLTAMSEIRRVLEPCGRFVFSVPHPAFPFLRAQEPPFFFDRGECGYFSGRDMEFHGRIWRRDGTDVPVRCVHKTFADYFLALAKAGFAAMPDVHELGVTDDHLTLDPDFFGPLVDQPLHVAFRIVR